MNNISILGIIFFLIIANSANSQNCPDGLAGQKCRFQNQHQELMTLYNENLKLIDEIKDIRIIQSMPSKVNWLADVRKSMSYIYWLNVQYGSLSLDNLTIPKKDQKGLPNGDKKKPEKNDKNWNPFGSKIGSKNLNKIPNDLIRLNPDNIKPETNQILFNDSDTILCIPSDVFESKIQKYKKQDELKNAIVSSDDTTCLNTDKINSKFLQNLLESEKIKNDKKSNKIIAVSQAKLGKTLKEVQNQPVIISDLGNSLITENSNNDEKADNKNDYIKESTEPIGGNKKNEILEEVIPIDQFDIDDYDVAKVNFCAKLLNKLREENSISENEYKRRIIPCKKNKYFFSSYKLGKYDPTDTTQGDRAVELMNEILNEHHKKHGIINEEKLTVLIYGHGDFIPFTKEHFLPDILDEIQTCKIDENKINISYNDQGNALLTNEVLPCVRAYYLKKYLVDEVNFIGKDIPIILRGKVHKKESSKNDYLGVPENRAVSVYFIKKKEN